MKFNIITIFPRIFDSYFNEGIIKRAQKKELITINTHDLRQWTFDKHRSVDDTPYGGGAGMVMKIEPIYKALQSLELPNKSKSKIILLSAKGKKWNQQMAKKYSNLENIILICGRYEGVDEKVVKFIDEEISIGDYVLTGGEIGAMTIVDSITRLLPGVLGNAESSKDESHSTPGILEYPQYTRPAEFKIESNRQVGSKKPTSRSFSVSGLKVPKILLSGDHKKIKEWRKLKSKKIK